MKSLMSFFSKKKHTRSPNYVRPKDIKKTSTNQPVQELHAFNNNKPNVLFMDDNFGVIELMKADIEILASLYNDKLAYGSKNSDFRYENLWDSLSEAQREFLKTFNPHNYNFYFVTTNTCGLAVENALKNGMKFHGAILDIILGGIFLEDDGSARIIDGIDIAYQIRKSNPKAYFKIYTACTLGEYSEESIKFKKYFNKHILDRTIYKNSDINKRREEIISLLMEIKLR